jgi:esterase/lipase superfamily enzyme
MKQRLLSLRVLPGRRLAIGILAAALMFVAALVSGSVDQVNLALNEIGFDPDRAQLITALLVGAVVAAVSILAGNRTDCASLLGCLGAAALFVSTFVRETQSAMASTGEAGLFDLGGWLITVFTLVVSGLAFGWAGAALAGAARPTLADTIGTVRSLLGRQRVEKAAARRAAGVAVVAVVLLVTVPVFGDIVNYTPDARMLHGHPPLTGLGGPDLTLPPASEATPRPSSAETPSISSMSPSASWSPTPADQHPWLAWRPSGDGHLTFARLPGPWEDHSATANVTIYTPPGYSSTGSRRYPVLYESPYGFLHWDEATNVVTALNVLIDKGLMPPVIVVSMSTEGGPFEDSECADSYDGREWFDTYASQTVVPYIDAHYLTIAEPSARAILGASQGGYCAAALGSRHPEVWATSLVFSGYFHAGGDGPPADEPFGKDKAFIDAASPDVVIFKIPEAVRPHLYFRIVAQFGQTFYGPEALRFGQLLDSAGIPHTVVNSAVTHGWAQLRTEFPAAMDDWAAWMVSVGVF